MYARFGQAKVKPGKLDEFVENFRSEVVPRHKQKEGGKGITILTDVETNSVVLISYWATEADALAMPQNAQLGISGALLEGPPVVQLLKVPLNEV